jgi:hypothetical protein
MMQVCECVCLLYRWHHYSPYIVSLVTVCIICLGSLLIKNADREFFRVREDDLSDGGVLGPASTGSRGR